MPAKKKQCFCSKALRCCGSSRSSSCLGRCCLVRHNCIKKKENSPGPVPPCMGWLYNALDAPDFQLRCGWRPGHIACPVLKAIERHNNKGCCSPPCSHSPPCSSPCSKPCSVPCSVPCSIPCSVPCSIPCSVPCSNNPSSCKIPCPKVPSIRITRTGGKYSITTNPADTDTSPCGPYPLKYVVNMDASDPVYENTKYAVEAKYNDYQFTYTSSVESFVLDFAPPDCSRKCSKPCIRPVPTACFPCVTTCNSPGKPGNKKTVRLSETPASANGPQTAKTPVNAPQTTKTPANAPQTTKTPVSAPQTTKTNGPKTTKTS